METFLFKTFVHFYLISQSNKVPIDGWLDGWMDGCVCVRGWGVIFLKPMKKLCVLATLRMFLMIIMHFDLVGICLLFPPRILQGTMGQRENL